MESSTCSYAPVLMGRWLELPVVAPRPLFYDIGPPVALRPRASSTCTVEGCKKRSALKSNHHSQPFALCYNIIHQTTLLSNGKSIPKSCGSWASREILRPGDDKRLSSPAKETSDVTHCYSFPSFPKRRTHKPRNLLSSSPSLSYLPDAHTSPVPTSNTTFPALSSY